MTLVGLTLLAVALLSFFVFRRIAKLPSRYERNPGKLSPWSALDRGIDPTISSESDE